MGFFCLLKNNQLIYTLHMRGRLTEKDVRIFIQDYQDKNTLIDGVRFSSEQIEHAMIFAVDQFNSTPPHTYSYAVENFPSISLLLKGTVGYLFKGEAFNQASNEFDYSAAGVSINDNNKAGVFSQLGGQLWQEFKEELLLYKASQNIGKVFGGTASEYSKMPYV